MTTKQKIFSAVVLIVVIGGSFAGGYASGKHGFVFDPHSVKFINENGSPIDYSLLWKVNSDLQANFLDSKDINQQQLMFGAIQGMVAAAGDPYTVFFDPKSYSDFSTQLAGNFDGIGAEVGIKDGALVIIAPLDGTPAKAAGLLPGDIITKINGTDTTGLTVDGAVGQIRGQKGTQVTLEIYRQSDSKTHDFTITRDTIMVPSVKYAEKTSGSKKYELITVNEFGDDTTSLFAKAAADATANKVDGIVLDLRDDPGGYLDAAVNLASYWVPQGKTVVSEAHATGDPTNYAATGNNFLSKIPTVVLVNGGTASAAEILSGALHDYGFAKLVGEKTFGKGSVQQLLTYPVTGIDGKPAQAALKVTIAKWLTPNGININHNGLDPDVPDTVDPTTITATNDPQLDTALKTINLK